MITLQQHDVILSRERVNFQTMLILQMFSTGNRLCHTAAAVALFVSTCACQSENYQANSTVTPPPVMREFRASWIPTVGNSCWPSKPGLPVGQQKAELIAQLDRAAELNLNAVIFQVRPACDALYKSELEPWSEYLTGAQGKMPVPYYDPLEFAVSEAHKRGLELHAWFNPYRARHKNAKSPVSANHISKSRPDLTRTYGSYLWLDPGERDVQDYSLRVVMDVVKRYDVDAVHFDDYFYPYEENDSAGQIIPFPDEASWKKFGARSGLTRDDWRRRNVDQFIERVNQSVHAEKPWVKFGLSPFGIWRPGHPPQIKGYDPYVKLYADAKKWLVEGWCDYMAPQLYWAIEPPAQSFPALLAWWNEQNPKQRHLWPGINSLKVGEPWPSQEIVNQIEITRKMVAAPGVIHWSHSALMKKQSLQHALNTRAYQQPALIPAFRWLDPKAPTKPSLKAEIRTNGTTFKWSTGDTNPPALWVLQTYQFSDWKTEILAGGSTEKLLSLKPEQVALTAVDRCGNASSPASLKLTK